MAVTFGKTYYVNVEDFPHLEYILCHSHDYYLKIVSWEKLKEKEFHCSFPPVPRILIDKRVEVFARTNEDGSYKFLSSPGWYLVFKKYSLCFVSVIYTDIKLFRMNGAVNETLILYSLIY